MRSVVLKKAEEQKAKNDMTWRRLIAAGMPRLEEVNQEVRQFGVAVPGGAEHVGLRARVLH